MDALQKADRHLAFRAATACGPTCTVFASRGRGAP